MKKILIAVDYNPLSENVVKLGCELAKQIDAEVCLMHVVAKVDYYGINYPTFMGYTGYNQFSEDLNLASELNKVAQNFLKTIAKHLESEPIKISTNLQEGETSEQLLDYMEKWKADILVMGTHSHSALEKIFMGSVASKVLEHTKTPVYLVPLKGKE